jgi:hypothetical protein
MCKRWLVMVPFLSAIFCGSCRVKETTLPASMVEMDVRYAVCAWASGMITLVLFGVFVRKRGPS